MTTSRLCASPDCPNDVAGDEQLCEGCQARAAQRRAPKIDELGLTVAWRQLDLDFDAWQALLQKCAKLSSSVMWAVGDLLAFGSWRFAEKYQWAIEHVGIPHTTAQNWAYVSRNLPRALRRRELSHAHHRHVAKLDSDEEKDRWLQEAIDKRLTEKELCEALAAPGEEVGYVELTAVRTPAQTPTARKHPAVHADDLRPKRRRLRTDPPPEQIAVRLIGPPEQVARWRAKADQLGISVTRLCAIALDAYCAD